MSGSIVLYFRGVIWQVAGEFIMKIEIVHKKDPNIVARLNKDVQTLHFERFPEYFKPYDCNAIARIMEKLLENDNWDVLVASHNGKAIGYALLIIREHSDNPFKMAYTSLVIDQMCVEKAYQNKGIGAQLMNAVSEYAREKGIRTIELSVWKENLEAVTFYRKMGFRIMIENMAMEI
jgi:diamine N-acetyltransferase